MVKKLGSWHRPDRKDSEKIKCSNEKARQTFLQKLPVSVWRVVIIPVLMMKTHAHADENRNLFLQKITFCSKRTGFPFFI